MGNSGASYSNGGNKLKHMSIAGGTMMSTRVSNGSSSSHEIQNFIKDEFCGCQIFNLKLKKMYLRSVNNLSEYEKEIAKSKLREKGINLDPVHSFVYFDYKCSRCKKKGKFVVEYGINGKGLSPGCYNSFQYCNSDNQIKINNLNASTVNFEYEAFTEFTKSNFDKYNHNC